jgi:hypothetical protein
MLDILACVELELRLYPISSAFRSSQEPDSLPFHCLQERLLID